MAKQGQVVFMNNEWDRITSIDEAFVAFERQPKMMRSHFDFGCSRGSIKVSNDKVWQATYRFFADGTTYTREFLRETETEAREVATRYDVCDAESEELISLVAA